MRQALLTCAVADGAAATDLWVHAKVSGNNNTWVKDGPGTLVFSGANNTDNNGFALRVTDGLVVLGKASSPTCHAVGLSGAGLTLSNGTVQLAGTGGDQIYINTDVRLDGGVFDLNGRSEGFDGLSGAAGVVRNDAAGSAGTLTIGQANGGGQFNGVIEDGAGTVALTKMGTNTNILTGANTHSGPTVIGAGALRVGAWGGSGTLGTGNVTNNAALQLARGDYGMLDLGNTITGTGRVEVLGTYSATNGAVSLVTLSGDNSFTGTVTIATGALRITRSTSLGAGTKVVTMSNGTAGGCNLRLDPGPGGAIDLGANISFNSSWLNGTLYNLSGTNIVRGNWNLVGGGGDTAIISSNGFLTLAGLLRPSATDANRVLRLGGPADGLVTGDVANNGTNYPALRKIGPGAWTLNGTNTYTGPTLIDQGRLALGLTGSSSNSAAITVANGAVLDVTGTASIYGIPAGQTLAGEGTVTGSLAVSGDFQPGLAGQAGTMVFDNLTLDGAQWQCHVAGPTGSGATNDFVFAAGALALSSAAGVNQLTLVHPLNRLPGGTYVLITNRAARTVGGAADVALVNSNLYRGLTLDDSDPFSLRLMVAAPLELEWAGGTTGAVWDVGVSYAWNTNLDTFILGDGVWFTDFGGASNQVTLAGTLKPDLVRIQSSSNYTFTGSGKISGTAGLDKQGTGSLTIGSANDYTGPTTIGGGTVRVANAAALGAGAGATIVLPGGVLDVNSRDVRSEPVILSGGMLWNGWTQQLEVLRQLTVISNSAVGSSSTGRFGVAATGSGPTPWVVVSNDATLAVNAGNFDLRNGIRITNHGAIAVNSGGFLRVHLNARSQGGTGIYTVATGGTLELGSFGTQTVNSNDLVLAGGQLSAVNAQGANPMQAGALTAAGTGGVVSVSSNLYLTGPLLGTGTLAKIGAQELILSNDVSAFAGVLAINAGGVRLVQTQALELISPVTNSGPGTTGSLYLDTPGGVTVTGALHLGSQLRLAQGGAVPYAQLTIQPGATVGVADFWIGEHSGGVGDVWQNGGSVLVSNSCRVGHYPNETSHYVMAGGTLTLSATPTGIVNRTAQPEDIGILYVGIDGMAVFTQKAGVASAAGMVLDARGTTANPHEFTQEGGTFTLGASGIKSGSLDSNANYQINLGGGTLAASANWTSTLAMTLSGVNGPAVFDSAGRAITLHGRLSGAGGLTKAGVGSLTLRTNETYLGNTEIMAGSLILAGAGDLDSPSIHVATGALFDVAGVAGGTFALKAGQTLKGGGAVTGNVQNSTGATVAPGSSPGILTLQGNYTEQPGSILAVEVKGAAAGSGYDQLAVQGTAMLAGTLALDTGSYLASTSTAHVILTASNVTGAFANAPTSGAEVAGGSNVFVVTYTPTAVVLTARPAIVDADGDGLTSDLDPDDRNPNTDGGAMGDYDEWLAYGNATSVYEAFFLTSVGRVTNGTLLMWPAISNRSYRVFSTTNPVSGFAAWTNLVADLPPNSDGRYTNAPPRRFEHFRLDVRLPP